MDKTNLVITAVIKNLDTGQIFKIDFQSLIHAQNYINNEKIAINRNYEIVNIIPKGAWL